MFGLKYRFMEGEPGAAGGAPAPAGGTPAPAGDSNFFAAMPDDWRTQLAGDDSKRLTQLERVSDMPTFVNNYFSAQDRIRKGELSTGLPDNPSDEQLTEWREANGVPSSPADYKVELSDGLVMGDEDLRILDKVLVVAHANNVSNSVMSQLASAMLEGREVEAQQMSLVDDEHKNVGTQQLKQLWGNDYAKNLNTVMNWMGQLPETIRDDVLNSRMGNGMMMTNSPEFLIWAATQAFDINPSATVVPNSNNPMQSINTEIEELEARMGTDEWYKDRAAQERYQELINAKDKMENK